MKISAEGTARIKRYESCVLTIYKDAAGLPTIGYGHLLTIGEKNNRMFEGGISQQEAEALLLVDLIPAETAVNKLVTVPLTQPQYDSLVSFTFNCGVGALNSSSLLKSINKLASNSEITNNILKWNKITDAKTGKLIVSNGLTKRRLDEAKAWA